MRGHWCFSYPLRMPRGSRRHVNVLNFLRSAEVFSQRAPGSSGGRRLQRYANSKITDLGPRLKFMKRSRCPLVSLCRNHATRCRIKRLLFVLFIHASFYNRDPESFSKETTILNLIMIDKRRFPPTYRRRASTDSGWICLADRRSFHISILLPCWQKWHAVSFLNYLAALTWLK